MRVAHFDCFSGISGDMTLAALLDLGVDAAAIQAGLASLQLPIKLTSEKIRKGGFAATQIFIDAPQEDTHRFLPDIEAILARGSLTERQRLLALRIFHRLAAAEAEAHGMPVERVHFHEVGALDSIADIVGCAIGLDLLGVERFTSTGVVTGTGTVTCAHGVMPIPTPGTAALLKGVPLRPSAIKGELTTPTGAAILTTVVAEYTSAPAMTIEQIGHGAGSKDLLEQPNLLRIFVGSTEAGGGESDTIWLLETNLDDIAPEIVGYCYDLLFAAGAVDVWTTAIHMKKNRPGILLSVLAPEVAVQAVEAILFRETGTFGIRRTRLQRSKRQRETVTVQTPWGEVRAKRGWRAGGESVVTPEYEDCVRVARAHGLALRDVYQQVTAQEETTKYKVRSTKYEKEENKDEQDKHAAEREGKG